MPRKHRMKRFIEKIWKIETYDLSLHHQNINPTMLNCNNIPGADNPMKIGSGFFVGTSGKNCARFLK
jgi:hypothetical protein